MTCCALCRAAARARPVPRPCRAEDRQHDGREGRCRTHRPKPGNHVLREKKKLETIEVPPFRTACFRVAQQRGGCSIRDDRPAVGPIAVSFKQAWQVRLITSRWNVHGQETHGCRFPIRSDPGRCARRRSGEGRKACGAPLRCGAGGDPASAVRCGEDRQSSVPRPSGQEGAGGGQGIRGAARPEHDHRHDGRLRGKLSSAAVSRAASGNR
jgi:hypothetical protein